MIAKLAVSVQLVTDTWPTLFCSVFTTPEKFHVYRVNLHQEDNIYLAWPDHSISHISICLSNQSDKNWTCLSVPNFMSTLFLIWPGFCETLPEPTQRRRKSPRWDLLPVPALAEQLAVLAVLFRINSTSTSGSQGQWPDSSFSSSHCFSRYSIPSPWFPAPFPSQMGTLSTQTPTLPLPEKTIPNTHMIRSVHLSKA